MFILGGDLVLIVLLAISLFMRNVLLLILTFFCSTALLLKHLVTFPKKIQN